MTNKRSMAAGIIKFVALPKKFSPLNKIQAMTDVYMNTPKAYKIPCLSSFVSIVLNYLIIYRTLGGIRTPNNSSEDCCDIHFTTRAIVLRIRKER